MTGLLMFNDPRDMVNAMPAGALPPVTAGERFATEYEDIRTRSQGISESRAWYDAYERVGEAFEKDTGKELVNPLRFPEGPGRDAAQRERQRQLDEARAGGRFYSTDDDIKDQIAADLQTSKQNVERARAAPQSGFSEVAGVAGQMAGVMADPSLWPTLFAGAGAGSVLRGMAIEGLIGGGTELPLQLKAQAFNRAYGVEYSNEDVFWNTLAAAGGGAAVYGTIRGIAGAVRRMFPDVAEAPRPVRDALNVVEAEDLHADLRPREPVQAAAFDANLRRALAEVMEGAPVTARLGDDLLSTTALARGAPEPIDAPRLRVEERPASEIADVLDAQAPVEPETLIRVRQEITDLEGTLAAERQRIADLTAGVPEEVPAAAGRRLREIEGALQVPDVPLRRAQELGVEEIALLDRYGGREAPAKALKEAERKAAQIEKRLVAKEERLGRLVNRQIELERDLAQQYQSRAEAARFRVAPAPAAGAGPPPEFTPRPPGSREMPIVSRETPGTAQARENARIAKEAAETAEQSADARAATVKQEIKRLTDEGEPEIRVPVGIDADGNVVTTSAKRALETADARIRDAQAITQCAMGSLL